MMLLKRLFRRTLLLKKKLFDFSLYVFYARQFKHYLKLHNYSNKKIDGEKEYQKKWGQFGKKVEPYSFRFFSHFMCEKSEIVPENLGRSFVESKLNPVSMRGFYEDKNMFPFICGVENVPRTVICRMNGGALLDDKLQPLSRPIFDYFKKFKRFVLKPSVGSSSGRGVKFITLDNDGIWKTNDNQTVTIDFLKKYNKDFVLQEAIEQHPEMASFCNSSVNTLRLAVYRSWKDEKPHVLACVMRVGKSGALVDNAHAGGMFVGIDIKSGKVGHELFDQYGFSCKVWNDLDYSKEMYIPCWEKVIDLAEEISSKVIHHRLLALDIAIGKNGLPKLIEYNIQAFSYWLFMFTNQKPLGDFSDEIIDFCK